MGLVGPTGLHAVSGEALVDPRGEVATYCDLTDRWSEQADEVIGRLLATSPIGGEEADAIIMAARRHWFDDEEGAEEPKKKAGRGRRKAAGRKKAGSRRSRTSSNSPRTPRSSC